MAVIPASHRLDLHRVRELLGATSHLRLATEAELAHDFPMFDVGAMPPLGAMMPMPEVIDVHLLYHERIVCAGGDHRHALRIDPRDLAAPVRAARGEPVRDAGRPQPLPGPAARSRCRARTAAVDDRGDHDDGEHRQLRERARRRRPAARRRSRR